MQVLHAIDEKKWSELKEKYSFIKLVKATKKLSAYSIKIKKKYAKVVQEMKDLVELENNSKSNFFKTTIKKKPIVCLNYLIYKNLKSFRKNKSFKD